MYLSGIGQASLQKGILNVSVIKIYQNIYIRLFYNYYLLNSVVSQKLLFQKSSTGHFDILVKIPRVNNFVINKLNDIILIGELMNLDNNNIIIMKCGTHASEKIEDIFNRKKLEEINNGYTCWGYGGTLCPPTNQVQPFCKTYNKVYLLLTPTNSELNNDLKRAEFFSIDKYIWLNFNSKINVYGSKYALIIKNLQKCDFEIDLKDYEIAIGKSKGKNLSEYLQGRVYKACAIKNIKDKSNSKKIKIVMIAELVGPYSIFVK